MATFRPEYSQWRTSDKIYLFKQSTPDELLIRVYDRAHECLFKKRVQSSGLNLPENIKLANHPRSLLEHLVSMQVMGKEFSLPEKPEVDISLCKGRINDAISHLVKDADLDSALIDVPTCPITMAPFKEPVIIDSGQTFEKEAIKRLIDPIRGGKCPVTRQKVSGKMTPNFEVKRAVEEQKKKAQFPNISLFEEENAELAGACADMASTYRKSKKYAEALNQYLEMARCTKDPKLYQEVVNLFSEMKRDEELMLSQLYLAIYQLEADEVDASEATLKQVYSASKGAIEVLGALVELYLSKEDIRSIATLLHDHKAYSSASDLKEFLNLGDKILAHFPNHYPTYELLALCSKNKKASNRIFLRGACEAIQDSQYRIALDFCEKIEGTTSFIDHMIQLRALELSGKEDQVAPILNALIEQKPPLTDPTKALKYLAGISPSIDVYRQIVKCYKEKKNLEKSQRWYGKWLSFLMNKEDWAQAEEVALEALESAKKPIQYYESLQTVYEHINTHKLKETCIKLGSIYLENDMLSQAARVYRLGCERFGGYDLTFGHAEVLAQQSKKEEAVKMYFGASELAILEDKRFSLGECVGRIKSIDPEMKILNKDQQVQLLTRAQIARLENQMKGLVEHVWKLQSSLALNLKDAPPMKWEHLLAWVDAEPSAKLREKRMKFALSAVAFGAKEWQKLCGQEVDEEPPLTEEIYQVMSSPCPFWPGKTVGQTHKLLLVPKEIGGNEFCLSDLVEFFEKLPERGVVKSSKVTVDPEVMDSVGYHSPEFSHWMLITKESLKQNFVQSDMESEDLLKRYAGDLPYKIPSPLQHLTSTLAKLSLAPNSERDVCISVGPSRITFKFDHKENDDQSETGKLTLTPMRFFSDVPWFVGPGWDLIMNGEGVEFLDDLLYPDYSDLDWDIDLDDL